MPLSTLKLRYPILVRGKQTDTLVLCRRANLGDIRASSKGIDEMDALQILVSRLCEITRTEADEIDATEIMAVNEWLAPFVAPGPTTGEPSP